MESIIVITFSVVYVSIIIYACSIAIENERLQREIDELEIELLNKIDGILENLKEHNNGN